MIKNNEEKLRMWRRDDPSDQDTCVPFCVTRTVATCPLVMAEDNFQAAAPQLDRDFYLFIYLLLQTPSEPPF